VQALLDRGAVETVGDGLRLKGRGRSLSLDDEAARTKAIAAISAGGLAPPTLAEVGRMLALPVTRVAELLQGPLAERTLIKVARSCASTGAPSRS
jgi:selenocysteine-specific elongation factor